MSPLSFVVEVTPVDAAVAADIVELTSAEAKCERRDFFGGLSGVLDAATNTGNEPTVKRPVASMALNAASTSQNSANATDVAFLWRSSSAASVCALRRGPLPLLFFRACR